MAEKKRIIDALRETKSKKEKIKELEQISIFDFYDIEDIVIKVRKKDGK